MPEAFVTQNVPQPPSTAPKTEAASAVTGSDIMRYALDDHQHPSISSRTKVTLDANGAATTMFSKTFASEPELGFAKKPGGPVGPCVFEVDSWVMSGSDYIGANIKGYRLTPPQTQPTQVVLGITLVLGGNAIATYGPANGVNVSVIVLPNG